MRIFIFIQISLSFLIAQDEGITNYQNQNYEAAEKYYDSVLLTDTDNSQAHFGIHTYQQENSRIIIECTICFFMKKVKLKIVSVKLN